jgi:hypothetical protein
VAAAEVGDDGARELGGAEPRGGEAREVEAALPELEAAAVGSRDEVARGDAALAEPRGRLRGRDDALGELDPRGDGDRLERRTLGLRRRGYAEGELAASGAPQSSSNTCAALTAALGPAATSKAGGGGAAAVAAGAAAPPAGAPPAGSSSGKKPNLNIARRRGRPADCLCAAAAAHRPTCRLS